MKIIIIIIFVILIINVGVVSAVCATCNETCSPCGGGCTATDLGWMFDGVVNFDVTVGDITGWNTSCVTNMQSMFQNAWDFNQDIGSWDVSSVTDMSTMFYRNYLFNQNISGWNTSSVTDMYEMFNGAQAFNQDIGNWDTSGVTDMSYMFFDSDLGISMFNQDIGDWDVGNVVDMSYMFNGTTNFNQNLSLWNVSNVLDMTSMFSDANLSTSNYDALLSGWGNQIVQNNVFFSGGNSLYSNTGLIGRNNLIGIYNWTITDGGFINTTTPTTQNVVGWDYLINGSIGSAAYVGFNTPLKGYLLLLLFCVVTAILLLNTTVEVTFIIGLLFFGMFNVGTAIGGGVWLNPVSFNIILVILAFELAGVFYKLITKT